jgi:hypothetical protein
VSKVLSRRRGRLTAQEDSVLGSNRVGTAVGRGRGVPSAVFTVLLFAAVSGCGDADVRAGGPIVEDSAGVRIITNPGAGVWDASEGWRLEEELRVGVDSGDAELQFGMVAGVDADEEGRIYVLDSQARRIRVFDGNGRLIRAFGRSGEGPGELSQALSQPPGGLFVDGTGAVAVPDLGNQRLSRFSPEGEVLESPRIALEHGIPVIWARAGDRTIHYQVRRMDMAGAGGAPTPDGQPEDEILRLAAGASEPEPVASFPSGETITMTAGGLPEMRIFAPETVWTVLDDGRIVTGSNAEYSLMIHDRDGEPRAILRRAVERRPVTERDEANLRGVFERAWDEAGVPGQMIGQLMGNLHFEPFWPALAYLISGPDGTIWVQRIDRDAVTEELTMDDLQAGRFGSPEWDVFDPEGTYLGVVEMPAGVVPMRFEGDHLYGVHRDELDVQRVVRLRLVRGGG